MTWKMFIGYTENGTILTAEFGFYKGAFYDKRFHCSFEELEPFILTEENELTAITYWLEGMEDCDPAYVLDLLRSYGCTWGDLPKELYAHRGEFELLGIDYAPAFDGYYAWGEFEDGVEYTMETLACGQHDPRNCDGVVFFDEHACYMLFNLWDMFHLRAMPAGYDDYFNDMVKALQKASDDGFEKLDAYMEGIYYGKEA